MSTLSNKSMHFLWWRKFWKKEASALEEKAGVLHKDGAVLWNCYIPRCNLYNKNLLLSRFVVLDSHQHPPKSTDQPLSADVPWPLLSFGSASSRQMWNQFFSPWLLFLIGLTSSNHAWYSPAMVSLACLMAFALSGALEIKCQRCQGECFTAKDEYQIISASFHHLLLCFTFFHMCRWLLYQCAEIKTITDKSLYDGLMMQKKTQL